MSTLIEKNLEIKLEKETTFKYAVRSNGSELGCFVTNPTFNCQLMTVGGFNGLSSLSDEKLQEIFSEISYDVGKKQFLFDVNQGSNVERIERLFPNILMKADYINGTGSPMCIIITTLREYIEEDYEYDDGILDDEEEYEDDLDDDD